MGSKVTTEHGNKLANYWSKEGLNESLNELVKNSGAKFVLNCASQEYASAVDWDAVVANTPAVLVHAVFQASSGRLPSVYAKQARGELVRFAMTSRAETVEELAKFTGADDNFAFVASDDPTQVVFVRSAGPAASASASAATKKAKKPTAKTKKATASKAVTAKVSVRARSNFYI
jgi:cytoplasmic iron level regulating protein YaaA (DUF328/UPF0246 family)